MPQDLKGLINLLLTGIINPLLIVLAGLSLLVFFKGLAQFIFTSGGDKPAIEEGKDLMKWGLIALFILVSLLGVIRFFYGSFFTGAFGIPLLPGGLGR